MAVSFTIDLEDPTGTYASTSRYITLCRRLLDACDEFQCRATFFTVGRVAETAPQLLRDISTRGHEIAYHSHAHIALTNENPKRFRTETSSDKQLLEQLSGKAVLGFRAPRFSLTPQSAWALDVLGELGFAYSSSIMPTDISLYGFRTASRLPFRWPNGMVEFPLPVAAFGKLRFPYLGGIYLYASPAWLTRIWLAKADPSEVLWTYTHPYDFDRTECFKPFPNTPFWISLVLWTARRMAEKKIRRVLSYGISAPLGERLKDIHDTIN